MRELCPANWSTSISYVTTQREEREWVTSGKGGEKILEAKEA